MKLIDAHIHLSDTEYAKCTDELVAETDSPVNYRKLPFNGQLTRPSFIITVVEAVAEAKNMTIVNVANQIARNFEGFFNIKLN